VPTFPVGCLPRDPAAIIQKIPITVKVGRRM
jgi:hypothetical protein